ncbi:MAG: D-alanyl-D-alanine carboxypeptidase [Ruminococcus sp.]|uniref:D-alanyl-D-alanine carboxypeptidase family protein n=1 Tax=Ruminococcus sp. TaxID=41978 RepID=UPI002873C375|nr:D-alanyl-D-alanine carboxypeptidase family protein [Ruminococcus sp.]MBQ3285998.1 D-alanyl-D-alanine carboxypeptidase [Ruminococcus sp.]
MKRLFCTALILIIIVLSVPAINAVEVNTSAEAYVLYCPDNGEILLSDNADQELPIASTTKIMTTLLTLEAAADDNRTVEFTDEMTAEGSSMYLKRGEKVTLYDLAVGMMMQSGNDAANAAAISIAGSIEDFAALMNEKAQKIGMSHTHFVTPSGLDDEDHYSTARDMALLMAYALQNDDFAYITSQTSMEVHFIYPADKFITYPNHNKLLRMYDDCIGGKTGYTDAAGRTLVSAARRSGLTLIAVTLNDHDDWDDHIALYDYGFANFEMKTFHTDERMIDVVGGEQDSVLLDAADVSAVVPKEHGEVNTQIMLPAFLYAPVQAGDSVGKVSYTIDDKVIAQAPLTASESIDYHNNKRSFIEYIKDLLHWHS